MEFPELRYFRFEDESDSSFFKYCCEKSPKLEEIHVVDSGYVDSMNGLSEIVTSIGSLSSRPTLRSLLIGSHAYLHNINDEKIEPLSKFFNYPKKAGINRPRRDQRLSSINFFREPSMELFLFHSLEFRIFAWFTL